MVDWNDDITLGTYKYEGREIHLQGLYRGFSIQRKRLGTTNTSSAYYYFLGNPHTVGAYTADTSDWYTRLLRSIATAWGNNAGGTPPTGHVNAPNGHEAYYRGTSMWDGS
ncbi:MAG TPA: hypothetical protein VGV37_27415 [Aliidongia sp.]|uniref:hypothetical protein n=1 Tax=Aliidongia sp. TaxID=1914230 RepID=UPI002DDC92A9|nr:hypothetical protein [Aliidongia sp.]HEV2678288.1 hypothetical protein [Aliidongia sp.]